jgi:hypothetical protein
MYLDCYAVFREGQKRFYLGTIKGNLSLDKDCVTNFKNVVTEKIKDIKNMKHAMTVLQTPESFVPMHEAIVELSGFGLKPRALRKLKKRLKISGIWLDISTGEIITNW